MALFKTTAELKVFAPQFSKNMSWDTLKPLVELAEITYMIPFIGQAFYDELNDAYNAETPALTEAQTNLISKIKRSMAFYTVYEAAKNINSSITDAGVMEASPDKAAPARQWNHNMTLASSIETADRFLDIALKFLEDNEGDYSTWAESAEYTISKELFINKTSELSKHVPIGQSRRSFLQIRNFILISEEKYIIPAIGQELYDLLKEQLLTSTLTAANKKLLGKYIQRPLAYYSFIEALPSMIVEVKGAGIRSLSTADGITQSKEANEKQVNNLINSYLSNASTYLATLKKFIEDNATAYPVYKSSSSFENGQPNLNLHDNRGKKSFMV